MQSNPSIDDKALTINRLLGADAPKESLHHRYRIFDAGFLRVQTLEYWLDVYMGNIRETSIRIFDNNTLVYHSSSTALGENTRPSPLVHKRGAWEIALDHIYEKAKEKQSETLIP